jgi:hypothetical protein
VKIENHGSFCNIYENGGISFGTQDYDIAKDKLKKHIDIDTKLPLWSLEMKKGNKNFALKLEPRIEFIFDEDRKDIEKELLANVN